MKFGLLYEMQLPRPWSEDDEYNLFQNALTEVEEADRLGYDNIWANEHHFLEEYSHSSAPEVFLAACAARTKSIRLGHAVVLSLPGYNHPARIAERLASLDLISGGRVEFGSGESASRAELEGFNIDHTKKREMWTEATDQVANMMAMSPYPGFNGEFFSMPCRNVVPKPYQKPHPPMWLACSRKETIHLAARCGIGALTFAFVSPEEAGRWAQEYYDIIKSDECVPIGHSVNANIACVTGFSMHEDPDEARRRGAEGFNFFGYSLGHHYVYGHHVPGVTNIWERFKEAEDKIPQVASSIGIGSIEEVIEGIRRYRDGGIDQMILLQQSGRTEHSDIMDSIRMFAEHVMPEFKRDAAERAAKKEAELAPYIEAALARKKRMPAPNPEEIGPIVAFGKTIAAGQFASNKDGSTPHSAAGLPVFAIDPIEMQKRGEETA